jgi:hypothetical protein
MTQSRNTPPGPRPAPLAKLEYAMLATFAGAIIFFVLMASVPVSLEAGPAIGAFLCLLAYLILLPQCLVKNHWRPPHIVIRLAWVPVLWMTGNLTSISLLYVAYYLELSFHQWRYVSMAWAVLVVPVLLGLVLYRTRRLRCDQFLVLVLAWFACLALFGVLELVLRAVGLQAVEWRRETMSPAVILVLAFLLALPSGMGILRLLARGQFGTTPVNHGQCIGCDYKLPSPAATDESPACPECGTVISATQQDWIRQYTTAHTN